MWAGSAPSRPGWYLMQAAGGLASWLVTAAVYFGVAASLQLVLGLFRAVARLGRSAWTVQSAPMKHHMLAWILALAGLTAQAPPAAGQDWPQWRGPNRDGAVTSFSQPASWPDGLTERWKVEVGLGYATPLLVGDRIYMYTRQDDDEVMMALDAASGQIIWRTSYPVPFSMNPATAPHRAGPKSTPTFADGRLFTLGISGIVTAFDADAGRQLWQKPAPPAQPMYHTAMSPVVDGDLVIIHIGGHNDGALTAFDVATGDVRWSWDGDGPAYGSPMVFDVEGTRQVVTFTQENRRRRGSDWRSARRGRPRRGQTRSPCRRSLRRCADSSCIWRCCCRSSATCPGTPRCCR